MDSKKFMCQMASNDYSLRKPSLVLILVALLLNGGGTAVACFEAERDALLGFKAGIVDPKNWLSAWQGADCCKWTGVGCDNRTGHVVRLNLPNPFGDCWFQNPFSLQGEISPSLLGLKHLRYLNLSYQYFNGFPIPKFLGSFHHLKYLDLRCTNLAGVIPHDLGNLSSLLYLDLAATVQHDIVMDDARWLSRLASLQFLRLNRVNLAGASKLFQALNMLSSLEVVHLYACSLGDLPQSLPHLNFTALSLLNLDENNFNSSFIPGWIFQIRSLRTLTMNSCGVGAAIPASIGNATSLEYLDLSFNPAISGGMPRTLGELCNLRSLYMDNTSLGHSLAGFQDVFSGCIRYSLDVLSLGKCQLTGPLPDWLGDLKNLTNLDLSENRLYGSIPASIGGLSSLKSLQLQDNTLKGNISESLGQLSELIYLDLRRNNFSSIITESHFSNISRLKHLELDSAYLIFNVSSDWLPPFQLEIMELARCHVGPKFPAWLRNQENISSLALINVGISDSIPDWFWNISYNLQTLVLTDNNISGRLPRRLRFQEIYGIELLLGSNLLEGPVPYFPPNVLVLDLSKNRLSGAIPPDLPDTKSQLSVLSLSSNFINGGISSVCNFSKLAVLLLQQNLLTGDIPDCWNQLPNLGSLNLAKNNLRGRLPDTLATLQSLQVLAVDNNKLDGEFPAILRNCTSLTTIFLGHNRFSGNIPFWVGETLPSLRILSLRHNNFFGDLPLLSTVRAMHYLDLSNNNFSGTIPSTYGNFTGMMNGSLESEGLGIGTSVITKGAELLFPVLPPNLRIMDLSGNNLWGEIPEGLTKLIALQGLNLSNNHLAGDITGSIGMMQSLESLDLSRNELTGPIPLSMRGLHYLQILNLSHNNFTGQIPFGGQMTFIDPDIYADNPYLCGFPLDKNCIDGASRDHGGGSGGKEEHEEEESGAFWMLMGIVPGYVVGFWAVLGTLLLKYKWRYAYFRFADSTYDMIYVKVAVNVARFKRKFAGDEQI